MPKVHFGEESYEVDDGLYRDFLEELLIGDENIEFVLSGYKIADVEAISDYVKYRLAEVDPGYTPEPSR